MTRSCLQTNNKAAQRAALFLSILAIIFSSCRKNNDEVGVDFLPQGNNYASVAYDSFDITAYTIQEDSLKIDSLSATLLGAINDPEFGTSSANMYTQVLLREINVDFGTNPTIDSVILSLARKPSVANYGNENSEVELDIFRMDEIILSENKYYSNYEPKIQPNAIGKWTGNLASTDTVWYEEAGELKWTLNTIRIPLNNDFGEDFFSNGKFGSNEVFVEYLNGIALIPNTSSLSSGKGQIIPIDRTSDNSKLVIYYNQGLIKEFEINAESQNISTYRIEDRNPTITNQISNPNVHYSETYLQAMGGSKVKIDIGGLYDLVKDGNSIAINDAKITFKVKANSTSDDFPAPDRLLLLQPSEEDGSNAFIIDLIDVLAPPNSQWNGYTTYGGTYDEDSKSYTFGINRHIQLLLDTYLNSGVDNNRGLYLIIPSDNPITPSRVILDTDNSGTVKNIRLKVTYTKL